LLGFRSEKEEEKEKKKKREGKEKRRAIGAFPSGRSVSERERKKKGPCQCRSNIPVFLSSRLLYPPPQPTVAAGRRGERRGEK